MLIDPMSLKSAEALPVRVIESSTDVSWKSALVQHHQVLDSDDVFETVPTSDETVVVMTRGEQHLESYRNKAWRSTTYQPGTVGVTPGDTISRLRRSVNRDAGAAYKVNIYIPQSFFAEAADHLGGGQAGLGEPFRSGGRLDEAVRQLALALIRAMRAGAPDAYAESAVRWLALHLSMCARGSEDQGALPGGEAIADRRLQKALDCIGDCYMKPLSVADLAAAAGISRFHFSRLFRQATGASPYRRLLETRLGAARRMLETSDLPVGEVASRCGFERANYFAAQYAQRFGMRPRDTKLETARGG